MKYDHILTISIFMLFSNVLAACDEYPSPYDNEYHVSDEDSFLNHPWFKELYLKRTIESPPLISDDTQKDLRHGDKSKPPSFSLDLSDHEQEALPPLFDNLNILWHTSNIFELKTSHALPTPTEALQSEKSQNVTIDIDDEEADIIPSPLADRTSIKRVKRSEPTRFKCGFRHCPYRGVTLDLKQHMISSHAGRKPFKCSYQDCLYEAMLEASLNSHEDSHIDEPRHICPYKDCSYPAKNGPRLTNHMKRHNKKYTCDHKDCDFTTQRSDILKKHTDEHSAEKPYACGYEGCFHTAARMVETIKHHTCDIPHYTCPHEGCTYATSKKSLLASHLRKKLKRLPH